MLSITKPEIIEAIHLEYLEAGADIIETNTFNAQKISLADYHMESLAYELNFESAKIAKQAVALYKSKHKLDRAFYVAGAIGPTNRTLSLSPDVNKPGFRAVSWDQMVDAYCEQINGLVDGVRICF